MKMSVTLKKFGLQKAFDYLYKDPEKHIRTLFGWAEKYGGKMYPNLGQKSMVGKCIPTS